jgi:hypothetical protein
VHGALNVPTAEVEADGAVRRNFQPVHLKTPRGEVEGGIDALVFGMGFAVTRFTGICETLEMAYSTPIDEHHLRIRYAFTQPRVDGKDPKGGSLGPSWSIAVGAASSIWKVPSKTLRSRTGPGACPSRPRQLLPVQVDAKEEPRIGVVAAADEVVLYLGTAEVCEFQIEGERQALAVVADRPDPEANLPVEGQCHGAILLFGAERCRR